MILKTREIRLGSSGVYIRLLLAGNVNLPTSCICSFKIELHRPQSKAPVLCHAGTLVYFPEPYPVETNDKTAAHGSASPKILGFRLSLCAFWLRMSMRRIHHWPQFCFTPKK